MFRILSTALALSLSTGCAIPAALLLADALDNNNSGDDYDYDYDYVDTGYGYYDETYQDSTAEGLMRGQMPETGAFDRDLTTANVWRTDGYVDFELHALDGNWAMLAGGFQSLVFEEGQTVTLQDNEQWVYGCSGPSNNVADYDLPAEEVTVRQDTVIIDGEAMVELTITASFGADGEVTAVVVQPQPQPNPED